MKKRSIILFIVAALLAVGTLTASTTKDGIYLPDYDVACWKCKEDWQKNHACSGCHAHREYCLEQDHYELKKLDNGNTGFVLVPAEKEWIRFRCPHGHYLYINRKTGEKK